GNQVKILQVIKDLASNGMTVIMATHFPDHAFLVAGVVAILNNGQISQIGSPDVVITEESMKLTYGVDTRIICVGDGAERKVCLPSLL
ncbi:MAG TPA: ABC transporter ATP-binding protein, partial [Nitrospirota bacterium]|nr:ABC transporter ATP-binding protein [Nitrospirota bacterium]